MLSAVQFARMRDNLRSQPYTTKKPGFWRIPMIGYHQRKPFPASGTCQECNGCKKSKLNCTRYLVEILQANSLHLKTTPTLFFEMFYMSSCFNIFFKLCITYFNVTCPAPSPCKQEPSSIKVKERTVKTMHGENNSSTSCDLVQCEGRFITPCPLA